MKRTLFFLLMLASSSGWARDKDGEVWVQGAASCGQFVQAQAARVKPSYDEALVTRIAVPSWLAGFITAYNMQTPDTYSILGNSDMQSALMWVENYCKGNPLEDLSDAANALAKELYLKRHRTRKEGGR